MKTTKLVTTSLMFVLVFTAGIVFSQTSMEYKSKIEKLNKEMAQNMIQGYTEKNLSMYTKDAISMPSYEPIHEGIDAIKEASEKMEKSGWKCTSFEPTTLKVVPNGNMITEIGTYKISMTMPGMDKPMDDQGKYLTIWEKQKNGSLKVKVETWNSDLDPMTMMKSMDKQMGNEQKEEK
jgi:ketosteroid isomerase-like protein